MKIRCYCGSSIIDKTHDLPNVGYLIPDQEWFATFDAFDDEVIDLLASGQLSKETAYRRVREILSRSSRGHVAMPRVWATLH